MRISRPDPTRVPQGRTRTPGEIDAIDHSARRAEAPDECERAEGPGSPFLYGALQSAGVVALVLCVGLGAAWLSPARPADATGAPSRAPQNPGPYLLLSVETPTDSPSGSALLAPRPELPAARVWLLDGFNVLHAGLLGDPERREWWTAPNRERLLERAGAFCEPHTEIWVVFDGSRPAEESGDESRVRTVFAPSADDWIVKRVRAVADPAAVAVVTGDHQVGGRVRHRGAHVVSPRRFLARCG